MYQFHKDRKHYFNFIQKVTKDFIIPFINIDKLDSKLSHVLEIGCAEGGVLSAFTELNFTCVGVELSKNRVDLGNEFMSKEVADGKIKFISRDIYDIDPERDFDQKFDLILLKDVIEHIFDQAKFFKRLHLFLKPGGQVFFGFPPWYMPFGGHQQVLKSKLLSKLPYFHLLPGFIYKFILRSFKESPAQIKEMMEIKETGISIETFEKLYENTGYKLVKKKHFLINPVYKYKFGWQPKEQIWWVQKIPFIRNFLTTGVYYLIEKDGNKD